MTAQNLAICFAPSMCVCDTENDIMKAQKFLEHCIENVESLFYVVVNPMTATKISNKLNRHTSTAIINAGPLDILNRLLYERSTIDPLITDWFIQSPTKNGDLFEMNLQFSSFMPNKNIQLCRRWTISENTNSIMLDEYDKDQIKSYNSTWHLQASGQGQTQVIHELEFDLRYTK